MLRFFFPKQPIQTHDDADTPYDQHRDPYLEQLANQLVLHEEQVRVNSLKQLEKEN